MNFVNFEERIESLKAGILGSISMGMTFSVTVLIHSIIAADTMQLLPMSLGNDQGLIRAAMAMLAGFLFGVTYRYIVRQDQNSHLKSGAVLSFGLVRGLAQIDVTLEYQHLWREMIALTSESLLLFAIAAIVLDAAIQWGWLKPCK